MMRLVFKCPTCRKKPWIRPDQMHGFIMGCCNMYAQFPTEIQTRSTWNEMAERKFRAIHS